MKLDSKTKTYHPARSTAAFPCDVVADSIIVTGTRVGTKFTVCAERAWIFTTLKEKNNTAMIRKEQ